MLTVGMIAGAVQSVSFADGRKIRVRANAAGDPVAVELPDRTLTLRYGPNGSVVGVNSEALPSAKARSAADQRQSRAGQVVRR